MMCDAVPSHSSHAVNIVAVVEQVRWGFVLHPVFIGTSNCWMEPVLQVLLLIFLGAVAAMTLSLFLVVCAFAPWGRTTKISCHVETVNLSSVLFVEEEYAVSWNEHETIRLCFVSIRRETVFTLSLELDLSLSAITVTLTVRCVGSNMVITCPPEAGSSNFPHNKLAVWQSIEIANWFLCHSLCVCSFFFLTPLTNSISCIYS
jgi:hypothetical protein